MTQQALRELVAKWRRELREVDSDRDNYSPPSADYFASELESLLGEQREPKSLLNKPEAEALLSQEDKQ